MQLDLFEQFSTSRNAGLELHELFDAYTECRGNKRNTANAWRLKWITRNPA